MLRITMAPRMRTSVFLDPELVEGLKALKRQHGTPEAESIRRAIAAYLTAQGVTQQARTAPGRAVSANRR
jgi:hypothetical protein